MYRIFTIIMIGASATFAQQVLTSPTHLFSFTLPSGWAYNKIDTVKTVVRYECFNPDSTAMVEIFALKTKNDIDRKKFITVMTSEEVAGESFGKLLRTDTTQVSGIKAVEKVYRQYSRRGRQIDVRVLLFAKANYGYAMTFRAFHAKREPASFAEIMSSFTVHPEPSRAGWFWRLLFFGICLYGLGKGIKRTAEWVGPFNLKAIGYSSFIVLMSAASFTVPFLFQPKTWIYVIIALAIVIAAIKLPDAKPVKQAFREAKDRNTAGAYRAFCQQYPASRRYFKEARQLMRVMVEAAVKKYKALIAKQDTTITRAILDMFEYIKATDNFQVAVCYTADNQIVDKAVYHQLFNRNVLPANPSFKPEKNKRRESRITEMLSLAFRQITPEDVLSFTTYEKPLSNQICFAVDYKVKTSGAYYYHTSEEHLPEEKRTWFTGVEFLWSLAIRIPNRPNAYKITLESKPAQHFTVDGKEIDKVYDAMADSAFADFCQVFIQQSGLAPAPARTAVTV
ncbi:MAG: hypothetical protein ONB48_11640 [candidate division KSB1 bacterium]|nr:hypothetical protein [candidate division KSB1 bacterium]MDZ7275393.1 hypothetical protein [candidate division KSB1 bacterium]MDZ7286295.1 hypothetical protein [candidate division KSB1 bacterium]MDZ7296521.1 hypothetical protein [candidate division KSB1 bacterium]MDZ7305520.1 hypothetical protein [candidate division KSB1 bacterium]